MDGLTLPEHIGFMVLPSCVLFPNGAMPLRIFEPRYRQMLDDALAGDCIFGIVNREREGDESDLSKLAAKVGTAGLIRMSREAGDGTSQLVLHGFARVNIQSWSYDRDYPVARISPLIFPAADKGALLETSRKLIATVQKILQTVDSEVRDYIMQNLNNADDPHLLADLVSQQFIDDPNLRQELLETPSAETRLKFLLSQLGG